MIRLMTYALVFWRLRKLKGIEVDPAVGDMIWEWIGGNKARRMEKNILDMAK